MAVSPSWPTMPLQIAVLSGKGGTGKTTVAACFAALTEAKVIADCDVDAPNLALLFDLGDTQTESVRASETPFRDMDRCVKCGACESVCRFGAITADSIDETSCEGCGACQLICPQRALRMAPALTGEVRRSISPYGPLIDARLRPGAESSGKLVTRVRQVAEYVADQNSLPLIIIDGPPGIGCAAIASITAVDLVVLVAEPTLSAVHDLTRVIRLATHFGTRAAVVLNKADIADGPAEEVRRLCAESRVPVVAEVPFDDAVPAAIGKRQPLVEVSEGPAAQAIRDAWVAVAALTSPMESALGSAR